MYAVALLFALVCTAYSVTEPEYQAAFDAFKAQYGKTYSSGEERYRYIVFKSNLDFVNSWDEQANGFSVKMNEFGDLSSAEFNAYYNGMNITRQYDRRHVLEVPTEDYAVELDWRTKGVVTGVKNQGQCGSCWAFSTTGSTEGAHALKTGQLVSLSEQDLVDCSTAEGNQGCNGGLMDYGFEYIIKNNGIDTEASYPYRATGPNSCQFNRANVGATIARYTDVSSGSESALQAALQNGPVSVAIDASHSSFQFYSSGVYYESACSSSQLDHGVLAVGYGTDGNNQYWIVKNSWGTGWGMSGYINMAKNRNNNCGIATAASWPTA